MRTGVADTSRASRGHPLRAQPEVTTAAQARSSAAMSGGEGADGEVGAGAGERLGHQAHDRVVGRVVGRGTAGNGDRVPAQVLHRLAVVGSRVVVGARTRPRPRPPRPRAPRPGRHGRSPGAVVEQLPVRHRFGLVDVVELVGPAEGGKCQDPRGLDEECRGEHEQEDATRRGCRDQGCSRVAAEPTADSASGRGSTSPPSDRAGCRRASSRVSTVMSCWSRWIFCVVVRAA